MWETKCSDIRTSRNSSAQISPFSVASVSISRPLRFFGMSHMNTIAFRKVEAATIHILGGGAFAC